MLPDDLGQTGGQNQPDEPLAALRAAMDTASAAAQQSDDQVRQLERWLGELARSGDLRNAPLGARALDMLEALAPRASLTEAMLEKLEASRLHECARLRLEHEAGSTTAAASPGALLQELRRKRGIPLEQMASAWTIGQDELLAVEGGSRPWWVLDGARLNVVSDILKEPTNRLVAGLRVAAMRYFAQEVRERAATALSRKDDGPNAHTDRREQIRFALAAIEAENRSAAAFFRQADDAVSRASDWAI
jgi:hypothetical protein